MKNLIGDLYKILYKLTGIKPVSLVIAIGYITCVTLFVVYGLAFVIRGFAPWSGIIIRLFSFPRVLIPAVVLFGINFYLMMPLSDLSKEKRKRPLIAPLAVYTLVAVILYLFNKFFDKAF